MKIISIARKSLLEIVREPMLLGMAVFAPLAFLLLYAAAYQTPHLKTHTILVVQQGAPSVRVVDFLASLQYADKRSIFKMERVPDRDSAEQKLRDRTAAALLILEHGAADETTQVTIRGDAISLDFLSAAFYLDSGIAQYNLQLAGIVLPVGIIETSITRGEVIHRTDFNVYAPGILVFAVLLLIPQTALLLGREIRTKTIRRLRLSEVTSIELLGGIGISQVVLAAMQVFLITAALMFFGIDAVSAWLPILLSAGLLAISAVGIGLVVGCFVQNDSQAVNLGSTVTMVQVFLSGTFFPLPMSPLLRFAGYELAWNDLLPATHAMIALQEVMLYQSPLAEILFRLAATALLSILFFLMGALLYKFKFLRSPSL